MAVLNATPDSFYDGGLYTSVERVGARIDQLLAEGADLIDIGGESSRPTAKSVPAAEQIARIEPAVRHALARGAVVSIDTTEPEVAKRMLTLGAHLVNDISCLANPELARVCAQHDATLILMHARGSMQSMSGFSHYPDDAYGDVVADVLGEWRAARDRAVAQGLGKQRIWLDPGLGFAKNARHSFELLRGLDRLRGEGVPVVVGASRKSFIAAVDDVPPEKRLGGSIAAALLAAERGASVLRVHDVHDVHQALLVARGIRRGLPSEAAHA
jgi:dihydropteroate synthase